MGKIPTVTISLIKKYASDTEGYLKIKVWVPGKNKFVPKSLGYKIHNDHWDAVNEIIKKSNPKSGLINQQIQKEREAITDLLEADLKRGITFTEAHIRERLKPKKLSGDFMQFYQEHINYLETKLSADYCNHFQIELNKLRAFAANLMFSDIDAPLLERYEMSMAGYAPTTINTKMKRLKEVVDKAISQGKIRIEAIAGYKWPAYPAPEKEYLTLEQTEQIGNAIYKGTLDFNIRLKTVACYFLIECYSGIRFSDWPRFTVEKLVHERNLKVRAKKNGEPIYLPLDTFKRLGKIIDYVQANNIKFTHLEGETNSLLKILAIKLEWTYWGENLTTHIGRHTCGTLLGEMGYSTRAIADVLGISEQTAKTYVKSTRQGLSNEFQKYGGL